MFSGPVEDRGEEESKTQARESGQQKVERVDWRHHRISIQVFLKINIFWARSVKPWESEMQVLEISGVCISTQVPQEMGTHWLRLLLQLWMLLSASFMVWVLGSSWHLCQPCSCGCGASHTIPTSSHCCHSPITLPMGTHIGTNTWIPLGASQPCSSWKNLWKRKVSPLKEWVCVGNSCVFKARQEERWLPNPRASSKMYLQQGSTWCENHFITITCQLAPMWQPSPACVGQFTFLLPAAQGGCCSLTSPSSAMQYLRLRQLSSAREMLLTLREWQGLLLPSCCIPTESPTSAAVCVSVSAGYLGSPSAHLAEGTPRVQCQRRMCDNTSLLCKTSPHFSCILEALFRAQPPCSASLEVSTTQIQRRNTKQKKQGTHLETSKLQALQDMLPLPILQTFKLHQADVQG